jgi:OOP family OmpA-OmpF porin
MNLRKALLAATILALPCVAQAQPITGLYIGGGAGVDIMQNEHAKVFSPVLGAVGSGNLHTQVGPQLNLSVGYGLGNGLRAEVEGFYSNNTFNNSNDRALDSGGREQKFGPMVNLIYDLGAGYLPVVTPYIGVGAGYLWTQENNLHVSSPLASVTAGRSSQGAIAYQGIIGASFPVSPALRVSLDYRFLGLVGNRDYDGAVVAGRTVAPAVWRMNDNYNHLVTIGFTYAFGAAPPPPPAPTPMAPAPAPVSRSYLVFFDWDKATLTDRARQIVAEAAANSTKVQYTRIEVNGYTDTSGTPRYNQGLSVRRAQAVAAELVKDGVSRGAIAIQGYGETHLLVPTGPGVREPQNRRVEIIIR